MSALTQFLMLIVSIFLIWQLYRYIRANPQMFSKINIDRSIFTLGILCLLLIAFVAFLVFMLRM